MIIQWRCCLKIVDGRTDGRRRTVGDHNSSPLAQVSQKASAAVVIGALILGNRNEIMKYTRMNEQHTTYEQAAGHMDFQRGNMIPRHYSVMMYNK